MIVLGIETATAQVSVALGGHEGVIALFELARRRHHAEALVPAIEFVCRQAEITLGDVGVVAVDVGPGLFTGMRVGLAAAKAIAFARRIPMIGISSLDLLAFGQQHSERLIVPVVDARRGEVYHAAYRSVPGGIQRLVPPGVATPNDLIADLAARRDEVLLVGDGVEAYRERFANELSKVVFADQASPYPSAAPLVRLAHARAMREEWVQPSALEVLYLRKPDAEINWSTRTTNHAGGSADGGGSR
jgi:tRNA threonylcarbamoyladenosine biosynthesis protein TsaB